MAVPVEPPCLTGMKAEVEKREQKSKQGKESSLIDNNHKLSL